MSGHSMGEKGTDRIKRFQSPLKTYGVGRALIFQKVDLNYFSRRDQNAVLWVIFRAERVVRIENMFLVTKQGPEKPNRFPDEIVVLSF